MACRRRCRSRSRRISKGRRRNMQWPAVGWGTQSCRPTTQTWGRRTPPGRHVRTHSWAGGYQLINKQAMSVFIDLSVAEWNNKQTNSYRQTDKDAYLRIIGGIQRMLPVFSTTRWGLSLGTNSCSSSYFYSSYYVYFCSHSCSYYYCSYSYSDYCSYSYSDYCSYSYSDYYSYFLSSS